MGRKTLTSWLGSAALAAIVGGVVGGGATYFFDRWKIEDQNTRLHKSEQREAYTLLGKDVQKLESDLRSAVTTIGYSVAHPKEKIFINNVDQAIDDTTEQMSIIDKTLASPLIEDSTRKPISVLLEQLAHKLRDVQKDRREAASLIGLYNQSLKQQLADIQKSIESKRTELPIERVALK